MPYWEELASVLGLVEVGKTHIALGQWCEAHARAVLDDGMAGTVQVDVHILALMDAHLPCCDDQNAVCHTSNVNRAIDPTRDDQTVRNVSQRQSWKWPALCRGNGHVNDAAVQLGQAARCGGSGRRGWENNVEVCLLRDADAAGCREAGLANEVRAWLGEFRVIVSAIVPRKLAHLVAAFCGVLLQLLIVPVIERIPR